MLSKAEVRDREIRDSVTRNRAKQRFHDAAAAMDREQVAELEAEVRNPEDLASRKKLLSFYSQSGEKVLGSQATIAARCPHILWLIAHHPENELAGSWGARIFPTAVDPLPDPTGYAEARKLWLAQADRDGQPAAVYSNAAEFFTVADKRLSEKMLLRAQAGHGRISRLYYQALMGSNASLPQGVIRSVSVADAHSGYAAEVRRKLDESNDAQLLADVGQLLIFSAPRGVDIGFDPAALGRKYVERAAALDPNLQGPQRLLVQEKSGPVRAKVQELRKISPEAREQALAAMPVEERCRALAALAELMYIQGDSADYYEKNAAKAKDSWAMAKQYGEKALEIAPRVRDDPEHGTAVFRANMTLGMVAMRAGDKKRAARYLLEASKAPASKELQVGFQYFPDKLSTALLKAGEREAVAEFLERYAQINVANRDRWLDAAVLIRGGKLPFWADLQQLQ